MKTNNKIKRKLKTIWSKWKNFFIALAIIVAIPIFITFIEKTKFLPNIINIPKLEILAYFGASIGLLSSAFAVSDKIEKKNINSEVQTLPILSVSVKRINEKVYEITIINISKHKVENIFVYDTEVTKQLEPGEELTKKLVFSFDSKIDDKTVIYNEDPNIIKNDFPKYIQICCTSIENRFWNCIFEQDYKKNNNYILSECSLV